MGRNVEDFGEYVFFTKEEAEQKLSEIEEKELEENIELQEGNMSIVLKDAVLFAYKKGLFTVEDTENYGCDGIYCENHGMIPNGFYCFQNADEYINKEDFLSHHTEEEIASDIAETIQDFINDASFPEEAVCYLYDIEKVCKENGKKEYLGAVQGWIEKAEKIVDEELKEI